MGSRDIQVKDRVCVLNIGFFFGCVGVWFVCGGYIFLFSFSFFFLSFQISMFFCCILSFLPFFSLFRNKLFGKGCISFGEVPNMRCRVPSNRYQVSKKGKHIRWLWVMVHGTLHAGQKRKGKQ